MKKSFFILLIVLIAGCTSAIKLDSVEITEYEGEDLSSVNDFRENSIIGVQYVDISNYTLEVFGLVEQDLNLSYDEVLDYQSYSKVVTLYCVEGWDARILWEGVLVRDLLDAAGVIKTGNTVIFHAVDGYTTSLPLDYFYDNDILLAYKMNEVTIPPERGYPFQLIAEDKWGYKWIKWIDKIIVSDNSDYEGFWESRGYSNIGDLDESFFD